MRKTEMAYVKMNKIVVNDMNDVLVCTLCNGYLIDATILTECHHVFCRGCILRYFENCKAACPSCNLVYKKKNQVVFRSDPQIQAIVYKVVPGLYSKEMQRREDFYRSTGVRASSSCSDDSVFERERDMINDEDSMGSSYVGEKNQFFGPEDSISLSLEYYQRHLDKTSLDANKTKTKQTDPNQGGVQDKSASVLNNNNSDAVGDKHKQKDAQSDKEKSESECKSDKRFLQCPAAVSMTHLQKFVRMKFALTQDHKVDIIYEGEVLPSHFSLMDVAYTFNWKKTTPMRFFYRIFTPLKIQPIKIVNTTLSTGGKQLQVVSSTKNNDPPPPPPIKSSPPPSTPPKSEVKEEVVEDSSKERESEEKERLLAHLQLQCKSKVQNNDNVPDKGAQQPPVQDCVFDYEEQDREEIKRFAEIRDREWAMQKKLDESREKDRDEEYHHFSKKRKKNKHSKNDNTHKKRKLHAEITNKEEDLKLKVKLTQHNGHKHKHHKSSSQNQLEASSKEKLLQMRQIRHKHVASEDKNIQTIPSASASKETCTETTPIDVKVEENNLKEKVEVVKVPEKPVEIVAKIEEVKPTNGVKNGEEKKLVVEIKKPVDINQTKTLRSDFPGKTTLNKEWGNRVPTVQIERNEQTEQQAKKTFLKSYQAYAEKYQKSLEKAQQIKAADSAKVVLNRPSNLERKIANLQQRCTIEPKNPPGQPPKNPPPPPPKPENKVPEKKPPVAEKPKPPPHYPPGFTVSKIESGAKRKLETEDRSQEKRPSLEITLINPPSSETKASTPAPNKPSTPTPAKRPPPATIPLDRIKKSFTFKGGLSIIPKTTPEKCDNIGALDLSAKPSTAKEGEAAATPSTSTKPVNGFGGAAAPPPPKDGKSVVNMSNLQMLSKVATEHHSLNKPKPKPQIPNLQTLRIPSPGQRTPSPSQRIPPKLQMIDKTHFRMMSPQIRNLRPNQNQNIRNIPNPSLLVRQQQNRLNSMAPAVRENSGEAAKVAVAAAEPAAKSNEAKPSDAKEVAV